MLNVETAAFQKGCTRCSRMNAFRQGSHEDSKIKLALEFVLVVVIIFCFCIPVGVSPPFPLPNRAPTPSNPPLLFLF